MARGAGNPGYAACVVLSVAFRTRGDVGLRGRFMRRRKPSIRVSGLGIIHLFRIRIAAACSGGKHDQTRNEQD